MEGDDNGREAVKEDWKEEDWEILKEGWEAASGGLESRDRGFGK